MEFVGFPKIARLSRDIVITEKIDGTNAQVTIVELEGHDMPGALINSEGLAMFAGSRTRWITPANDNHGFARWAADHADELFLLGPGTHFGEWWGQGIQRGYGLKEKRFSLFNTHRWGDDAVRPSCCHVVPVLFTGQFDSEAIEYALRALESTGSVASPGFQNPEGIVVFHTAANLCFKKTVLKDEQPKSKAALI